MVSSGDAHVVQRLEQGTDRVVMLEHAVDVFAVAMGVAATMAGTHVGAKVHTGPVEPAEERLAGRLLSFHVVDGGGRGLVVDRLHALLGERPGILDGLLANLAEARIDRGIVPIGRLAFQHAARAELGEIGRVLGVIRQFRLFLGVEMIEIAEELVEAVHGRQRLVAITDMVFAELSGGVAQILEQAANGRIELAHSHRCAGKAYLGKAAANAVLPRQKRRAARGARLLAVIVKELDPFSADTIDARRLVAHQAVRVRADVRDADIVTPDDQDIWLAAGRGSRRWSRSRRRGCWRGLLRLCQRAGGNRRCRHQRRRAEQNIATVEGPVFAFVR